MDHVRALLVCCVDSLTRHLACLHAHVLLVSLELISCVDTQTVVPSAITSGDTTEYQTFDLSVHTGFIKLVPKFQRYYQWINIKEAREQ